MFYFAVCIGQRRESSQVFEGDDMSTRGTRNVTNQNGENIMGIRHHLRAATQLVPLTFFLLAAVAVILSAPVHAGSIPPAVRYAFTANEADDSVSSYVVNSATGRLTLVSKVAAGKQPLAVLANTIFPPGSAAYSFVYALNYTSRTISEYSVSPSGVLVPIGTIATGVDPIAMAVCGGYLYVANYGYHNIYGVHSPGNVSEYSIAANGTLTSIGTVNAGTYPESIAAFYRGAYSSYVYVGSDGSSDITQYVVGPTGALIPNGTVSTGTGPAGMAVDGSIPALYVAATNGVYQYSINAATGMSTAMIPASVASGTLPNSISVLDGRSAFVTTSFGVYEYAIESTGALSALNPLIVPGGTYPRSIAVDGVGRYAYVADDGGNNVFQYQIGTGELVVNSPASVSDFAGPVGVAITYGYEVTTQPGYVYAAGNGIHMLSEAANGALTYVSTAPVPASTHTFLGIAVDPLDRYLYAYAGFGGVIAQYTIGAGGSLTPMSPASVPASTATATIPSYWQGNALAIDPTGRYVYSVSCGDNLVYQFTIGSGGALSPMATPSLSVGQCPSAVSVSPSGQYVYVTSMTTADIFQFEIGPGGSLTPLSPAWVVPQNWQNTMVVDSSGRYLYAFNSNLCQFDIAGDGTLSPVNTCLIAPGLGASALPSSVAVAPSGEYLYMVEDYSGAVDVYSIDAATGQLAPLSPVNSFAFAAGNYSSGVTVDPTGKYVYAVNDGYNFGPNPRPAYCVAQFVVGTGGVLTPISPGCVNLPNIYGSSKLTAVGFRQ
jgi:6-phosphogluconolactonase